MCVAAAGMDPCFLVIALAGLAVLVWRVAVADTGSSGLASRSSHVCHCSSCASLFSGEGSGRPVWLWWCDAWLLQRRDKDTLTMGLGFFTAALHVSKILDQLAGLFSFECGYC
jgi:hypothetical protein